MKLIVANLKMNLTFDQILEYSKVLNKLNYINNRIVICPSYLFVSILSLSLNKEMYFVGSQDVSSNVDNKCTGDVSSLQLSSLDNLKYCIVGHCERRLKYGEDSKQIVSKIINLQKYNIIPIICISDDGLSIKQQLDEIIPFINKTSEIVIAYEPVDSVGTGICKDLNIILDSIKYIKAVLKKFGVYKYSVIYGGSVNKNNCYKILNNDIIDGIIVGENSINIENFMNILENIEVLYEK